MNITVYLGANEGNDPTLKSAVRELGTICDFLCYSCKSLDCKSSKFDWHIYIIADCQNIFGEIVHCRRHINYYVVVC